MSTQSITLLDLDQIDRAELSELDETGELTFTDVDVDKTGHGEFVTGAVLVTILTVSALKALAIWLSMKRNSETIEIQSVVRDENGREEQRTIRWSRKESESAEADQLKALADALSIDLSILPQLGA